MTRWRASRIYLFVCVQNRSCCSQYHFWRVCSATESVSNHKARVNTNALDFSNLIGSVQSNPQTRSTASYRQVYWSGCKAVQSFRYSLPAHGNYIVGRVAALFLNLCSNAYDTSARTGPRCARHYCPSWILQSSQSI